MTDIIARLPDADGTMREYNLAGEFDAEALYAALPEEYQARVATLTPLVRNFKSPVSDVPEALLRPGMTQQLADRLKAMGARTQEEISAAWESVVGNVPTPDELAWIGTLASAASGVSGVVGFGAGVAAEAIDWGLVLPRYVMAKQEDVSSSLNSAGAQPSEAQARAFAIAHQAALYMQVSSPDAPEETRATDPEAADYVNTGLEMVWKWGRFYGLSLINFVGNGFNDWDKAQSDATATLGFEAQGFNAMLQENASGDAVAAARPQVNSILNGADQIAGIEAAPILTMLDNEGAYQGYAAHDGNLYSFDAATMISTPLVGTDGAPLSADVLEEHQQDAVTGGIGTRGMVTTVAGGLVAANGARGVAEGLVNRHINAPINRATAAAEKADAQAARLQARADAARAAGRTSADDLHARAQSATQRAADASDDMARLMGNRDALAGGNVLQRGVARLAESADQGMYGSKLSLVNPLNWGRSIGRGLGNLTGFATVPLAASAATDVRTVASTATWIRSGEAASDISKNLSNATSGATNAVRTAHAGALSAAADVVDTGANTMVRDMQARIARLEVERTALRAEANPSYLQNRRVSTITAQLEGRTTLLGRQIPGLVDELAELQQAAATRAADPARAAALRIETAERLRAQAETIRAGGAAPAPVAATSAPVTPAAAAPAAAAPTPAAAASTATPSPTVPARPAVPSPWATAASTVDDAADAAPAVRGGWNRIIAFGSRLQGAGAGGRFGGVVKVFGMGLVAAGGVMATGAAAHTVPTANAAGVPAAPVDEERDHSTAESAVRVGGGANLALLGTKLAAPSLFARVGVGALRLARFVPILGGAVTTGGMYAFTPPGATAEEQNLNGAQIALRDLRAGRLTSAEYAAVCGLQTAYCASGLFGFVGLGASEATQTGLASITPDMINRYFPASFIRTITDAVQEARGATGTAAPAASSQPTFGGTDGNLRFNAQLAALVGEENVSSTRNLFGAGGISQRAALDADRNGVLTAAELQSGYDQVRAQAQRTGNQALANRLAIHVRTVHRGSEIVLADGGNTGSTIDVPQFGNVPNIPLNIG